MHGCCYICFPNSCCDGKQARLVLLVDGVCKFDQDYVGELIVLNQRPTGRTTDNGVGKRSQAGLSLLEDIDSSTRGFVQFYPGTWMHMRGVYPLHMEGQRSHGVA